jgi:hypothetical protein
VDLDDIAERMSAAHSHMSQGATIAYDVWDAESYGAAQRQTGRNVHNILADLRAEVGWNPDSKEWLSRHYTDACASIEEYFAAPPSVQQGLLPAVKRQLYTLRLTWMSDRVTLSDLEIAYNALRDRNKTERPTALMGRAFRELVARKKGSSSGGRGRRGRGRGGRRSNSGSRNNSRSSTPTGNGGRGARKQ